MNAKVLAVLGPSGEEELDKNAFAKSVAGMERGVIQGPFHRLEDVPLEEISLIPRQGIWELHGGATDPSVRCIDNMLLSG